MKEFTSTDNRLRRSGSERRLKFITPYVELIFKGEEHRKNGERRSGEGRRKEPRE